MYPKSVIDALLQCHPEWLSSPQGGDLLRLEFADQAANAFAVEDWILAQQTTHPGIGAYLNFLRSAKLRFSQVNSTMGYWNANASHSLQHDQWSVGWTGDAMLPIANYLYVLQSLGVSGDCLECGAFKGSSTACLSTVCKDLGLTLYCADSFAGLPSAEAHYKPGDFAGTRAEVESNVRRSGCIEAVRFVEGWYRSSLQGFAHPLSLIWVDVDLQQSVVDVMENVFTRLHRHGVIFSDGFSPGVDFTPDHRIVFSKSEAAGFYRFFENKNFQVRAIPAGPKGMVLILPRPEETPWLRIYPQRFDYLVKHL